MNLMDMTEFIEKQNWIFAKTYAQKAPHEYVVRGKINGTDEEFMAAVDFIQANGITMHFWNHPNKYVFLGDYYYWTMSGGENDPSIVINRALIENYKISVSWKGM